MNWSLHYSSYFSMCQSLNRHISFPWWLESSSTKATLKNYLSLHKACMIDWCWKKKASIWLIQPTILVFFHAPAFISNILPTISRVIHNCQWLFSHILHELSISFLKAFLTFWMLRNLLSRYCHWWFLANVLVLVKASGVCKFLQQHSWYHAKRHIPYLSISLICWVNVLGSVWQRLLAAPQELESELQISSPPCSVFRYMFDPCNSLILDSL